MPIRINLLAEAQALEEQRRRDPVKRIILAGIVGVALMLAYGSSLFVKSMVAKGELTTLDGSLNSRTNEYRQIIESQRMLIEGKQKLAALHQLATNRFLVGSLLNTLQKVTDDNVQLVRLKIDQTYVLTEAAKPKSATDRSATKPATATEKIALTLNAKDISSTPGDAVNRYQEALSGNLFFHEALGRTNGFRLTILGTPQTDPDGKLFVLFTLEARFPEKTR